MPRISLVALLGSALYLSGCTENVSEAEEAVAPVEQALTATSVAEGCGYQVTGKYHSRWHNNGFYGVLELKNISGTKGVDFEIFADLGGATVAKCVLSECEAVEGGYVFSSQPWFKYLRLREGQTYPLAFMSRDPYSNITPYILTVNGVACDQIAPVVSLTSSSKLVTASGSISLTATATDNVAVRKVVFKRDGEVIGVDTAAPYAIDVASSDIANGRHTFTATAYDPSGNETTSNPASTLVAVGNKFFGTAVDTAADYTSLSTQFNQLTPGNSGKWGSVESTRDQMNWASLDTAYAYAQAHGMSFKLHTLVWGQQQPAWLASLTPEEQLAEIDQWMALAAERYPNAAYVDVVNEPLHAPPAYAPALGGAGATGWDWVIKSFEMARKHFPKAELLLNDYNVEAIDSAATDYIKIIDILNQRGLIDGIGLQSHFLERAEIPTVAANLDRFAATGLPIYVSELDVNFADDARQAQRMRDLFTLFWNHPSVVGVTHWGYLQGNMWRTDSYLLRADGTQRPALQWINCFRAGGGDCTVPDYVPMPRTGDASGITLEAEDYDDAVGLLGVGSQIAYTDNGDWQNFRRVTFDNNWDNFSITYSKGNEQAANITLHLGSLDSAPIATIPLPSTGGWSTSKTVSIPFAPISGERDLYIRFNGGYGIANVDKYTIGAPTGVGPNLIANGEFEADVAGWFTWNGTLATSNTRAVSGSQSLLLSNRSGNGPAATNVKPVVTPGRTYKLNLWTTIAGAATASVNLTKKVVCDGTTSYGTLVGATAIAEGQWTEMSAELAVPDCNVTELLVYAEGPTAGVDLYLDHVSLRAVASSNIVANGTFESGTANWYTWSGTATSTIARAHTGTKSLLISNRTGNAPAVTNLASAVTPGSTYQVSFWTTIGAAPSADVNLTQKTVCQGQAATYARVANSVTVTDGQWVELKGALSVPNCTLTELALYAEGPAAGVDLYVDDVMVYIPSNLLSDGTFESGVGGWYTWNGTLATTTARAHGGTRSLALTNRSGNGPVARSLLGMALPGKSYQVTFWVSVGGAATANVNLTQKIACDGTASYAWLANPVAVTDGQWSKLTGMLTVPNCNVTDLMVYAEGPGAGIDLYVDDVTVSQ